MVTVKSLNHNPEYEATKKYDGEHVKWCSTECENMFKTHIENGLMFRFTFADGFQMRLTLYKYGGYGNRNWSDSRFGITFVEDDLVTKRKHYYNGDEHNWGEIKRRIESLPKKVKATLISRINRYEKKNYK